MKLWKLTLLLLLVVTFSACGLLFCRKSGGNANADSTHTAVLPPPPSLNIKPPVEVTAAEKSITAGTNSFAIKLYSKVNQQDNNIFFSPYSISSALSMVYAGAAGKTQTEIANVFGYDLPVAEHHLAMRNLQGRLNMVSKGKTAELNIGNGLFASDKVESNILPGFKKILKEDYASLFYTLDFSNAVKTAGYINKWVEDRTKNRIKDLLTPDNISNTPTAMILVNTIYFKSNWQNKFNPENTKDDFFYPETKKLKPQNKVPTQLMFQQDSFGYTESKGLQVLELPYKDPDLSLLVFLPDDIKAFDQTFSNDKYTALKKALEWKEVKVFLPMFTLTESYPDLGDILRQMGMPSAFDASQANFSNIMTQPPLCISAVIHKAFIEVNEQGSEAAAATAVLMETTCAAPPPKPPVIPIFRADHPFVFMIIHKPTDSILFMGKMYKPVK